QEKTVVGLFADGIHRGKQLSHVGSAVGEVVAVPGRASPDLQRRFSQALDALPVDVNALVQWVLRESYMETTYELRMHAEKVKFFNQVKKTIREELNSVRGVLSGYAGAEPDALLDPPV